MESQVQKNFWFGLGLGWGCDTLWNLDVDREDRYVAYMAVCVIGAL